MDENPNRRWLVGGAAAAALLVVLNLWMRNGGPAVLPTAYTRGVVTYRGKPLNGGQIRFVTQDPANKVGQANAMINRDGTFAFGGAPVGPVVVTVDTTVRPAEDYYWRPGSRGPEPIYVPARFADPAQSGVTATLHDGVNEYDVRLD